MAASKVDRRVLRRKRRNFALTRAQRFKVGMNQPEVDAILMARHKIDAERNLLLRKMESFVQRQRLKIPEVSLFAGIVYAQDMRSMDHELEFYLKSGGESIRLPLMCSLARKFAANLASQRPHEKFKETEAAYGMPVVDCILMKVGNIEREAKLKGLM